MSTQAEIRLTNEAFYNAIETKGMEKFASDGASNYTRTKMREAGFFRKQMTFEPLTNEQIDRRIETDMPYKIIDKEPDSPAAITVNFGQAGLPEGVYIRAKRYPVVMNRKETPGFAKDVAELRTYHMDVRQILADNSVKDLSEEEDAGWIEAVDLALGAPDTPQAYSGKVQWKTLSGGWSRENIQEAFSIMPKTASRLEVNQAVVNSVSIRQILKWGRDEIGGDKAQDLLLQGWTDAEFMRVNWIVTIKRTIVPDDALYMFAHEEFLGKAFELEPPTMYLERKAWLLYFFTYEEIGAALGHSGGVARADMI